MSDNYDTDQDTDSQLAKDLRAQIRALGTSVKTLTTENDAYKVSTRTSTVAGVLKDRKVNPKIASFIPDGIEATEGAIGQWLAENGEVFGIVTDAGPADETGGGIDADTLAALTRTQQTEHAGGVIAPVGVSAALGKLKDLEGKSFDELSRLLK